jgi:predicted RNA binding protein YcfA (HicA-like mRNA interferase family)
MSIDYTHLRSVTARQIIKALEKDGFILVRHKGSHKHFKHRDGRRVTVTYHAPGTTFPKGTINK